MGNRLLSSWRSAPGWAVLLALALVAGLVTVSVRQVTVALRDDPAAGPVAGPGPDPTAGPGAAEPDPGGGGPLPLPELAAPAAGELAPGTGSYPIVGSPSIEPPGGEPVPDQVAIVSGRMPDLTGALPDLAAAPPDAGGGTGPGVAAPDVATDEMAPPPPSFGLGVRVTTGGHFATVIVGVSGGPAGLATLAVEFGDGAAYRLPEEKIADLGEGGTVKVVHRYEPTLTPQPQRVVARATDGAGESKQAAYEFETRAAFEFRFFPLTVTARDDCDTIGKGDFELSWELGAEEGSSRFDLGRGESYVEKRFDTAIYPVHYGERVRADLAIGERDTAGRLLTPWEWEFPYEFHGPAAPQFEQVLELGTHRYPITMFYAVAGEDNCDVRLDYTFRVSMFG